MTSNLQPNMYQQKIVFNKIENCKSVYTNLHWYSIFSISKARFKRRILHAPNAIQTMHNEEAYLIIYCLNCIRCMQNSTFETGLRQTYFPHVTDSLAIESYSARNIQVVHLTIYCNCLLLL